MQTGDFCALLWRVAVTSKVLALMKRIVRPSFITPGFGENAISPQALSNHKIRKSTIMIFMDHIPGNFFFANCFSFSFSSFFCSPSFPFSSSSFSVGSIGISFHPSWDFRSRATGAARLKSYCLSSSRSCNDTLSSCQVTLETVSSW